MQLTDGDIRYWGQVASVAMLAYAAWRWGGGPERWLAGVLFAMYPADGLNHAAARLAGSPDAIATGHLLLDLAIAGVALPVALHANRSYPLWFAALQLIALFAHLAQSVANVAPLAHQIFYIGPSYFQILLVASGIWFHRRRVRRHGPYRSWRSSSPRSRALRQGSWPNV